MLYGCPCSFPGKESCAFSPIWVLKEPFGILNYDNQMAKSLHFLQGFRIGQFYSFIKGFPGGSVLKSLPANVGDPDSIPESGSSPGEGNGNRFQYSCLGNPMDRGIWWATVRGVAPVVHS